MRNKKGAEELPSRSGGWRTGDEVEKTVQSEDEKDESEQETSDGRSVFHRVK
jgi:hypothetical protein